MKKKLYIFNENCLGANYGIGTYIDQLVYLYANDRRVETHVINIRANSKELNICYGVYSNNFIYNIPDLNRKLSSTYNKRVYYRNIFFLIRRFVVNEDNNIFLFFYNDHNCVVDLVKKYFGNGKIYFVVHFFCGLLEIRGNVSYFSEIVRSAPYQRNAKEQNIYASYEKDLSIFRKTDLIICLCDFAVNILRNIYGIKTEKIFVINNGLEDKYQGFSISERNVFRKNLFFENNEKIILYVGRLDENKGGKELLQAFRLLLQKCSECRLVIVGNGDESVYFEQMHMIWSKITFTGRLPKEVVYQFYQIADVGVLPSFSEQCSYVAIEMMMYGLPIIGTDTSGLSEMIVDGENGYKVMLKEKRKDVVLDIYSLSEKIAKVLTSSTLQKYMSQKSRMYFKKKYTLDEMWRKYYSLIGFS